MYKQLKIKCAIGRIFHASIGRFLSILSFDCQYYYFHNATWERSAGNKPDGTFSCTPTAQFIHYLNYINYNTFNMLPSPTLR